MRRLPRDKFKDKLVTWQLVFFAYGQIGMIQAAAGFFVYFMVLQRYLEEYGVDGADRRSLDILPREVELDAAVLAANYSKASRNGVVGVTLCRARQVSKPVGAKPGLVQLQGDVRVLKLNWQKERHRLDRLTPE